MIFDSIDDIREELEKIGAEVIMDDLQNRLIVNNKYCYNCIDDKFSSVNGHLGEGMEDLIKFIQDDNKIYFY